jgi:hypothetical protein
MRRKTTLNNENNRRGKKKGDNKCEGEDVKCRRDVDKKCELTFLLAESGVPFLQEEEEGESWAGLQLINFTKTCILRDKATSYL